MKKIYMKPETEIQEIEIANILAGSPQLITYEEQASSGIDALSPSYDENLWNE